MRIQFSSGVSSRDIYFGQVADTCMKGISGKLLDEDVSLGGNKGDVPVT
jgi:hypothetical protein